MSPVVAVSQSFNTAFDHVRTAGDVWKTLCDYYAFHIMPYLPIYVIFYLQGTEGAAKDMYRDDVIMIKGILKYV